MEEQPQIIELDPDSAPRTSAIILVLCGVLGVSFFVINVAFTGEDPYQRMNESDGVHPAWEGEDQYPIQEGYHIMPNLWRGREAALLDEPPEDEVDPVQKKVKKTTPTTGPMTPGAPGTGQPGTPGTATGTGAPGAPAVPANPNPFTVNKPGEPPPAK
jgi:hypothetical protein